MSDGVRALVVDDHPVFRDGLRQLLASTGEFVVVAKAADGREALAYVNRHPVDVVLMDLHMPRMDGVAAITQLRELSPGIRVLVVSTYDTDADVVPAIEAGAIGYLLKDAPRAELIAAVRAAARASPCRPRR